MSSNVITKDAPQKPAILFVGHGSRDNEAVSEFYQLAEQFSARFPDRMVETGFLEFVRPIIGDAVQKLVDQGAKQAGVGSAEFFDELCSRCDTGRGGFLADDSCVFQHPFDLLVQFVAVGDDDDAGIGVVL